MAPHSEPLAVMAGEVFIGIDLRPSNNQIYGLSASNKLFAIDAFTGSSTYVADLFSDIINTSKGYGFDFNPVPISMVRPPCVSLVRRERITPST